MKPALTSDAWTDPSARTVETTARYCSRAARSAASSRLSVVIGPFKRRVGMSGGDRRDQVRRARRRLVDPPPRSGHHLAEALTTEIGADRLAQRSDVHRQRGPPDVGP